MKKQTCDQCALTERTDELNQYECRANPPTMIPLPMQTIEGPGIGIKPVFPIVLGSMWCGRWRAKETTLKPVA